MEILFIALLCLFGLLCPPFGLAVICTWLVYRLFFGRP